MRFSRFFTFFTLSFFAQHTFAQTIPACAAQCLSQAGCDLSTDETCLCAAGAETSVQNCVASCPVQDQNEAVDTYNLECGTGDGSDPDGSSSGSGSAPAPPANSKPKAPNPNAPQPQINFIPKGSSAEKPAVGVSALALTVSTMSLFMLAL